MAGKRPAGRRYPHATTDAREHDHRWCPVAGAVAQRAMAGKEDWGTRHDYPAVRSEAEARDIKNGLYRARSCRALRAEGIPVLSVQADYDRMEDGTFRPWLRVWTKEAGRAEIIRRVKAGEPLHYNVMREKIT